MKQYFVDAFTDKPFAGNPADGCVVNSWLDKVSMILTLSIATPSLCFLPWTLRERRKQDEPE